MLSGLWQPISISRGGPAISHLLFMDDFLLCGVATTTQAGVMAAIMETFCAIS